MEEKNFMFQQIGSDGSTESAELHRIDQIDLSWRMKRKDFLATTALGIAAVKLAGKNLFADEKKKGAISQETYSGDCNDAVMAHGGSVKAMRFLPGMKHMVSVSNSTSPYERSIKFWEYPGRKLVKSLTFDELFTSDPYNKQGIAKTRAALESFVPAELRSSDDYKRTECIVLGASELTHWSHDYKIEKYDNLYTSGRHLIAACYPKKIVIINAADDKPVQTIHQKSLSSKDYKFITLDNSAIDRNERYLAIVDTLVKIQLTIWDLNNKKVIASRNFEYNKISSMEFSPDGSLIYAGFHDGYIRAMKTTTLEKVLEIGDKKRQLNTMSIKLSDGGDAIAACGLGWFYDKYIMTAELPSGKILQQKNHYATAFEFTPDSNYLAWSSGSQLNISETRDLDIRACFFDSAVLDKYKSVNQYQLTDPRGNTTFFVSSSKTPPAGAVCICNSVNGTYEDRIKSRGGGGGGGCSCNRVCTCVPVK